MDRVEGTGQDETLRHRPGHVGALPEVGEAGVGLAGDDARDLEVGDAVHVGQREPDRLAAVLGALEAVLPRRDVDVEPEDRDAEGPSVVEDEPLGVHARVMGEDPREEGGRMVGLEPRRLVRRQGEGGGVRLAEAEGREGLEDVPDPVDVSRVVAPGQGRRSPPLLDLVLSRQ